MATAESKGLIGVLGQESVTQFLTHAMVEKRLHHAYLFDGPEGVGKRTCAKALFAALNCEDPPIPGGACAKCLSCHKMNAGTHPDLILVDMTLAGLAEEIERLIRRLSYSAHEGHATMVLLDPADQLSVPTALTAANRLLKSLEEPMQNTYFVFISTNAQILLPTLRSRMQRLRFMPLPKTILREQLSQRHPLSNEWLDSMVELAQGSLGQALQNVEQKEQWQLRIQRAQDLLLAAKNGHAQAIVKACAKAECTDREESQMILRWLLFDLHQCLVKEEQGVSPLLHQIRFIKEAMVALRRFITPQLVLERMLKQMHPWMA